MEKLEISNIHKRIEKQETMDENAQFEQKSVARRGDGLGDFINVKSQFYKFKDEVKY